MIDGSAVKAIADLKAESMIIEVGEEKYSKEKLYRVFSEPRPDVIKLKTLTGLVDYLKENKDSLDKEQLTIHVEDFSSVLLFGKIEGKDLHRKQYCRVELDSSLNTFPFDKYLDHEDFIIKLRSLFAETTDRPGLIDFASKITIVDEGSADDNGYTQNVVIKKSASGALKERTDAPSIVNLAPYRTFREIKQIESQFLFRLKIMEGKVPTCALIEADGGEWKNKAVLLIRDWLKEKIENISIIA